MMSSGLYAMRQMSKLLLVIGFVLGFAFSTPRIAQAQATGSIHGRVMDPTGALVSEATAVLTQGSGRSETQSSKDGNFSFKSVTPGTYAVTVDAAGFATYSKEGVSVRSGQVVDLSISLTIKVEQQTVSVSDRNSGVNVNPDENASALVIKGADLDALSDNPNELANQLQALAGPAAGPDGGQLYVDGFSGGQIPSKSSIREIRINQNPFSAEFDRLGYGRIQIFTKPGTNKFHFRFLANASDSALNTSNPLVSQQPNYYMTFFDGNISGPLTKSASYFLDVIRYDLQGQSIVNAVNPDNISSTFSEAVPNPSSLTNIHSGLDLQTGSNNTLILREFYFRTVQTGAGVSALNLPEQAYKTDNQENTFQVADAVVVNAHLLNETRFQWRRIRNDQAPSYFSPTVTVQGAFTTGGNNQGVIQDHQDIFEFQNISTATIRDHTVRFGMRLRAYRDANYANSGTNGYYLFNSVAQYLAKTPAQYQATVISNLLARVLVFDGALFFQDDWRWKPNFTLSYGLRFEGQNRIHDHNDWAPRLALAWAPGHLGKTPPRTVLRAGYGWFYNRFTVANTFASSGSGTNATTATPYIIQAIHQNGINQQSYVIDNPNFYDPNAAAPTGTITSATGSIPSLYSIDPHFHAALDMQGGIGVDQKVGKNLTFNVTYLFTRGFHQYFTNNVTAPSFNPSTYTVVGSTPSTFNYQFQSGGVYKQHQLILTTNAQFQRMSLHSSYTFNQARSDTQGVTYFPSIAQDPSLDFGRPNFDIHQSLQLLGTISAPYAITFAPILFAQSGTPYNVTIGRDLTGNNQFNARPTYGTCGAADVVSTQYGCLDSNPVGKGEKIVPFGLGTGPANVSFSIRMSKVIGVGPKIGGPAPSQGAGTGSGIVTSGALSGGKLDATAKRKYNLTLTAGAINLFNIVNLASPNGTLLSPLFGKSQSLATGAYANPLPGNRYIFTSAIFSF
ncbi:TonB-dependent receptor [Granulicella sp. WH15]|uniref:TonB-dependent receptor n=1 Tax=Granulicella sp. WH15 TaxID=2602070 RepID=UPI001366C2D3|nr:carboxypeptidase regulatory-like domain-containing protein [Granulicella sp. WH15]QHN03662.1 TonB-dependent receptor [Granulicella sp. WH15]